MVDQTSRCGEANESKRRRVSINNVSNVFGTLLRPGLRTLHASLEQAQSGPEALLSMLSQCCDRIDACEPHVRALLPEPQRRERILAAAKELDVGTPLRGLLLGVKDIIAARGSSTVCGSALPAQEFDELGKEAEVVRRLRDAGMIVAGKTVTAEFAFVDPNATANPWNTSHTPGGSSSGSAAAVAAGEVHVALGTQTGGSLIRPAVFCGICGYKPSFGRISREGVAVYSSSIDTVGLYTPDAAGMILVAAVAVHDWKSAKMERISSLPVLGIPNGAYLKTFSTQSLDAFREAIDDLKCAGVTIHQVEDILDDVEAVKARHLALIDSEWAHSLKPKWDKYASLFRSGSAMGMVAGLAISNDSVSEGRTGRAKLRAELENAMDKASIDLWVTPGAIQACAPKGLENTGDMFGQVPWSHCGLPTFSLPAGLLGVDQPLPFGLQFAARFGDDERLLQWGAQLEKLGIAYTPRLDTS